MRGFHYLLSFICFIILSMPLYAAKKKPKEKVDKALLQCQTEEYECVRVKRKQNWQSLFPDERERDIVMRVNHTNQGLYQGRLIKIPRHLATSNLLDFSPFPHKEDDISEKTIIVDPQLHAWAAYDSDGSLIRWGPASAGSSWCRDIERACRTKSGSFRIYSLGSSNCISSKFPVPRGGAPMPYCMFFNGGQALHGSPGEVANGNISHGCVRLFVQDAEWLRYDFVEPPSDVNNFKGTKVIVRPYETDSEDDD